MKTEGNSIDVENTKKSGGKSPGYRNSLIWKWDSPRNIYVYLRKSH